MARAMRHSWLAAMLFLWSVTAGAACMLDGATIRNPDDPSCRDAMFLYTENQGSATQVPLGFPVPMPVDSLTPVDGFRSYDSLHARHQDLMLTSGLVHGEIVGQTFRGEDIWAYRLGDPDTAKAYGDPEGAVMLNGTIHAREWQSPEVVTAIIERLVEIGGDNGVGQYLAENLTTVILPVLNVDGFRQTQKFPERFSATPSQPRDGRMRRKNMNNSGVPVDTEIDQTTDNFFGVDLNRNSPHGFGRNNGSSSDPVSLVYRSASPASQPEILALQAAATLAPANRLRLYQDIHSFTQIYFTPLTGNGRRDAITIDLMTRMRAVTGFVYRDGRDGPNEVGNSGIGTTSDYFAYEYQIPSWTLEIEPLDGAQQYGGTASHGHSGFILPDSEIARVRRELTDTQILGLYRQAGPPRIQAVSIHDAASGAIVYEADWQLAGGARQLAVRTNRALVPGRDYVLWIAFDKPMRWRGGNAAPIPYPGQIPPTNGEIRVELGDPSGTVIDLDFAAAAEWLAAPGGAPAGYLRYGDDALRVPLTIADNGAFGVTVPAVLSVDIPDFSNQALDADPRSQVDWGGGHWTGYDSAPTSGNQPAQTGDSGGTDCSIQLFVALDANAAPPATTQPCAAAVQAPAGGGGGSSGGGGALGWLSLMIALPFAGLRRRRTGTRRPAARPPGHGKSRPSR